MLDVGRIEAIFSVFSELSGEELDRWAQLCTSAALFLEKRLQSGVDPRCYAEELCNAAAGLAFCDYMLIRISAPSDGDEVHVGNITVRGATGRASLSRAEIAELREHFLSPISDLLVHDSFVFAQIGEEKR